MPTLDDIFRYHAPHGDQPSRYAAVRAAGYALAAVLNSNCPGSPEQTLALRKVQEAVMWGNASIAINEANQGV